MVSMEAGVVSQDAEGTGGSIWSMHRHRRRDVHLRDGRRRLSGAIGLPPGLHAPSGEPCVHRPDDRTTPSRGAVRSLLLLFERKIDKVLAGSRVLVAGGGSPVAEGVGHM